MLYPLMKLGEIYMGRTGAEPYQIFLDKDSAKSVSSVLLIKLDLLSRKFEGVEEETFSLSRLDRYLFFEASGPRGAGTSPTAKFKVKEVDMNNINERVKFHSQSLIYSVLKPKVLEFFNNPNYARIMKELEAKYGVKTFSLMRGVIESHLSEISRELAEKIVKSGLEGKTVLISFRLKDGITNGEWEYLGECDIFREAFVKCSSVRFGYIDRKRAMGSGQCFVCKRDDVEVYGWGLAGAGLVFSTPDKPGFFPSLVKQYSWKYQPVCLDCIIKVKYGWDFVNEYLRYRVPNSRCDYIMIPQSFQDDVYETIVDRMILESGSDVSTKYTDGLINEEDMFLDWAKDSGYILFLTFLFVEKKQKKLIVHSLLDNVNPSWIKEVYSTSKEILEGTDKLNLLTQEFLLKTFYRKSGKISPNWFILVASQLFDERDYIEYIVDILSNKAPSMDRIISVVVGEIHNKLSVSPYEFRSKVISSFLIYNFVRKLFKYRGLEEVEFTVTNEKDVYGSKGSYEDVVEGFFKDINVGNPSYKAAFLLGVLVEQLFYLQRKVRGLKEGEEPFRKSMLTIYLDGSRMRRLFTTVVDKYNQYLGIEGAFYPKNLINTVAKYMVKAENFMDKANKDRLSYFFALGLVFGPTLSSIVRERSRVDEEQVKT